MGCGSKKADVAEAATPGPSAIATPSLPADPNEALHEQLSSGHFQLSATLDSIQEALKLAKQIKKDAKGTIAEAMADVVDRIDSCGSTLSEHIEDAPGVADVKKDFAKYDDQRIKTIDDVNDTIAELKEVKGMVAGLTGDTPDLEDEITKLAALIAQAMDDAEGTLKAFGGKEQLPGSVPLNPSPNASPSPSG